MIPEYDHGVFWSVESEKGWSTLVPGHLVGSDPALQDFTDYTECGEPLSFEKAEGWFARLSAPGYLDSTDWSGSFETEKEAREHVRDFYEVDDDTGECLDEHNQD